MKIAWNKVLVITVWTVAGLFAALIVLVLLVPVSNNMAAEKVEKTVLTTPLPEGATLCDSISVAGKVVGNGNGMQYFGAILIHSDQPIETIEKHYAPYRQNEWEFFVVAQTGPDITVINGTGYSFDYLADKTEFEGYYIVYSFGDSNYFLRDLDIRGH